MGNCKAAEVASVVIIHPGSKIERIYWSVSAGHVMSSNPGHYVAVVVMSSQGDNGLPVKQLKLLRPDDSLLIGKVYRLICFEDVLKEFAAKKGMKVGKLLKEKGVVVPEKRALAGAPTKEPNASSVKPGQPSPPAVPTSACVWPLLLQARTSDAPMPPSLPCPSEIEK